MDKVTVLSALGDNYIYLYEYAKGRALAVDPCDGDLVLSEVNQRGLSLTDVLVTHHHWDHTAGVEKIKSQTGARVVGADAERIAGIDLAVGDGDSVGCGDIKVHVLGTPGHTRTSVCYYIKDVDGSGIVFTGDTLFVGGCGRLFECGAAVMWDSLQKLASLGGNTQVYCGHDYTEENLEFALSVVPDDKYFQDQLKQVRKCIDAGKIVHSTIGQEKLSNIFLRANDVAVQRTLSMSSAGEAEVFTELRRRKDRF